MHLLFAIVSVFLSASLAAASSVPLLLWSPLSYFDSHSIVSSEAALTSTDALNELFQPLLSANADSATSIARPSPPELVITFLLPEFSSAELSYALGAYSDDHSADGAYAFIKDTLARSSSSITYLHSLPLYSEHELIKIVQSAQPKARTLTTHCDNAINEWNRVKHLGSNGGTDLLMVSVTESAQAAQCVQTVLKAVSDSNYLAVLSAKQAHAVRRNFGSNVNAPLAAKSNFLAQHAAHAASNAFSVQASSSASAAYNPYGPQRHPDFPKSYLDGRTFLLPGPLYILPSITLGLIVGLFLLVVLLVGLCCITDIERPVRMTNTPIQIPKEY